MTDSEVDDLVILPGVSIMYPKLPYHLLVIVFSKGDMVVQASNYGVICLTCMVTTSSNLLDSRKYQSQQ